ncbi:MAG TPA: chemotaxis protein CheA [Dissulfurispiraceae bacterium]
MVDFRKIYGVFVDEAMERLEELENGLLQLEKLPDDRELLNTVFRAAHTIKGSSGSIGLKDISVFTHNAEELLDMMRQTRIAPGGEIITVLLEVADMLREMVGAVASGAVFDFSRCAVLIEKMEGLKKGGGTAVCEVERKTAAASGAVNAGNPESSVFRVVFTPAPDLFRRGLDPSIFLDGLKAAGEIVKIRACTDKVPALSRMDVETAYMGWDVLVRTTGDEETLRKVFEFAGEGSEIRISPAACCEKQKQKKSELFRSSISSTIRVDLGKLDHLINTVGEMVIIHSMFQQLMKNNAQSSSIAHNSSLNLDVILCQLQRIGKEIQESAMALRMLPVGEVFQRFTRLVRELSSSERKDVELLITGEETELDKGVLEKITDPLVHIIRNSIDHGIELPDERISKGKPGKGTIHLSAYQMGDSVFVEVEDDGRGLNKEKILEKASSNGIIRSVEEAARDMTDDQVYGLIFLPGFSTADRITDISGRGVGMDVVKRNIESLNGRVSLRTRGGAGTLITIKIPLTLAIIEGLAVAVGDEVFIIPLSSVIESLRPLGSDVKTLEEKGEVVQVRREYIPLVRLHELLGITPKVVNPWEAIVVVTACDGKKFCLLVDDLIGQQQVVIKSLGAAVPKVGDIAGGTILGDGKVALVLDVPGIVEMAIRRL